MRYQVYDNNKCADFTHTPGMAKINRWRTSSFDTLKEAIDHAMDWAARVRNKAIDLNTFLINYSFRYNNYGIISIVALEDTEQIMLDTRL